MTTSNFNLRGISSEIMSRLKQKAKEQHISVNLLILKLVEEGIDSNRKKKRTIYHELDELAGTWSPQESSDFEKSIQQFEKIDKEIWK